MTPDFDRRPPIVPLPAGNKAEILGRGTRLSTVQSGEPKTGLPLPHPTDVPSLLPLLDRITSIHQHKYEDENTVRIRAKEAEAVNPELRTPEQTQLLADRAVIRRFTRSTLHEFVYSPDELHSLAVRFELFGQKNRPDFDEVESRVLEIIVAETARDIEGVPPKIRGAAKRARDDREGRTGMQWTTFIEFAVFASDVIRERMGRSEERDEYLLTVQDPDNRKSPDLTAIYQFVADSHAFDILGQRSQAVANVRRETFIANCQVINDWHTEVAPLLARLPRTIRIDRFHAGGHLKQLVDAMNARLEGKETAGARKDYRIDPAGAIKLQQRIGHTVETIKYELAKLHEPGFDESEIIPLPPEE